MWRNIVLHSFFQIIVLLVILFKGPQLFNVKSSIGLPMDEWTEQSGAHLSIFFDVFVFLQVFNFFNARKLKKDDINVFTEINDNYLFLAIVVGIFFCQLFIVQVGGKALKLVPLTMGQHFVCILIGSLSLVWAIITKTFVPQSFLNSIHLLREQGVQ